MYTQLFFIGVGGSPLYGPYTDTGTAKRELVRMQGIHRGLVILIQNWDGSYKQWS